MVKNVITRSFSVLAKCPVKLWGLSLLCSILTCIVNVLGWTVPIITIPLVLTITAGMSVIYLNGYNGIMPDTPQLFDGFRKENFARVCGGVCWQALWQIIWLFVPIANIVKLLQYSFTPFILMKRPEIGALEAIKISKKETYGLKAKMFFTNIIIYIAVWAAGAILALFAAIPYIGVLFSLILFLYIIACVLFLPLFMGLVLAGFYEEAQHPERYARNMYTYNNFAGNNFNFNTNPPKNTENTENTESLKDWVCGECQTVNAAGTNYCRACGKANPEK